MNKGCTQTADNVTNIKSQKYHLLKQHKVGGDWRSNVALVRFGKNTANATAGVAMVLPLTHFGG